MGLGETIATDICGYEARAVQMCILNIDLKKRPTKIRFKNCLKFKFSPNSFRIHCDNMGVVSSFAQITGCRHRVVKYVNLV